MELAQASAVGLMSTALVLGVRHGIDWDHIAAITDITSTASADPRPAHRVALVNVRALSLASLYALGHALIIAAVGGAASRGLGPAMMLAFIVGLLISNTTVAFLSATGFISSSRARPLYVAIGALAGAFSLLVGAYFLFGLSDHLPDLPGL